PDHTGRDERHGHRQEDDATRDRLVAYTVGEHGDDQAEGDDGAGEKDHPEHVVAQRDQVGVVGENVAVVVQPNELRRVRVEEAEIDRLQRGIDQIDTEEGEARQQPEPRAHPPAPVIGHTAQQPLDQRQIAHQYGRHTEYNNEGEDDAIAHTRSAVSGEL